MVKTSFQSLLSDDASSPKTWPDNVAEYKMMKSYQQSIPETISLPFDNASLLCANLDLDNGDGEGVMHVFLRWMKIVVLKLVRSYYALPIILVVLPMLIGLFIGFWVGRKSESNRKTEAAVAKSHETSNSPFVFRLGSWVTGKLFPHTSFVRLWAMKDPVMKGSMSLWEERHRRSSRISSATLRKEFPETSAEMAELEDTTRAQLQESREAARESGVDLKHIPKHVAVIMDGNRRYGKAVYGNATAGHWDGSKKVLEFAKWCIEERIPILTVYAFSSENWHRDPAEVAALMDLLSKYSEELRQEAIERGIRVKILSTDNNRIPQHVKTALKRLENDTAYCIGSLEMNICLSYGSRGEIVGACRTLAEECLAGKLEIEDITEEKFQMSLLTGHHPDPDVMIRTSGEVRLSNFLLWQLAYSEFFFVDVNWPAFEKDDLLNVIRTFAEGRKRRFGK